MTRLLLCTATILALTVSANAQALIIGGGNSPSTHAAGVTRGNYPSLGITVAGLPQKRTAMQRQGRRDRNESSSRGVERADNRSLLFPNPT
jgi:hypothetical protein